MGTGTPPQTGLGATRSSDLRVTGRGARESQGPEEGTSLGLGGLPGGENVGAGRGGERRRHCWGGGLGRERDRGQNTRCRVGLLGVWAGAGQGHPGRLASVTPPLLCQGIPEISTLPWFTLFAPLVGLLTIRATRDLVDDIVSGAGAGGASGLLGTAGGRSARAAPVGCSVHRALWPQGAGADEVTLVSTRAAEAGNCPPSAAAPAVLRAGSLDGHSRVWAC